MEQIIVFLVDPGQNLVFAPSLNVELETITLLGPFLDPPAHPTFAPAKKKLVVFDHIKDMDLSFCF
jgi:hypothetical protein